MWKVVVFLDNEVAAVPLSWLLEIEGKIMCFWPEKNASLKRAKDDNPASGSDKYKLHECRILMNDETFTTFKEALANEIRAQDVSHFDGNESDSSSSSKKQKFSDEGDEFEFIKAKTEINIIDEIKINEPSPAIEASKSENDSKAIHCTSLVLNKDVGDETNNAIVLFETSQLKAVEKDTVDKHEEKFDQIEIPLFVSNHGNDLNTLDEVKAFESSSTSEKLKAIFLNQIAEKQVYTELTNRLAGVEKHIKKYGGGAYSKAVEELPLQVASVDMFSQLEKELVDATNTALAEYFNKTIYENEIKKFVKILLNRFFDNEFFAHNVTSKSGGKVVLNKTRTLSCIYDSIEKKFKKTKDEVEDTVFKAIDQLKDSL